MYVIQNLHWFVIFIGVLVFVHELGHFVVAKACGIKVLKFSLGFGPRLFGFQRGETEYVVSALPLGGYVKMLGEMNEEIDEVGDEAGDEARSFNAQPLWQRAAVVLAGPAFNFVLAFVVYTYMFTGPATFGDTKLGIVVPDYPAYETGMRAGDVITKIDGERVATWSELRSRITTRPGETIEIEYERDGKTRTVSLATRVETESNIFKELEKQGRVGVSHLYVRPVIAVVDLESPAALAGLKTDDTIVRVGTRRIEAWHEVRQELSTWPAGTPVDLVVERSAGDEDRTLEVSLTPVEPPFDLPQDIFSSADVRGAYTGLVTKDVVVTEVDPETPAARIGLQPGDRLLRLGVTREGAALARPIGSWMIDLQAFSGVDARSEFELTFQRGREIHVERLKLHETTEIDDFKNEQTRYVFGAHHDSSVTDQYTFERTVGLPEALYYAGQEVAAATTLISVGLAKMAQGDVPLDSMGGPIMLFVLAEKSAKRGLDDFLRMMAIISVNLGLVNLLPIPVLDGGTLLFLGIEAVRRRPPSLRVKEVANLVGLAFLMLLMVFVFKNDILRFVLG